MNRPNETASWRARRRSGATNGVEPSGGCMRAWCRSNQRLPPSQARNCASRIASSVSSRVTAVCGHMQKERQRDRSHASTRRNWQNSADAAVLGMFVGHSGAAPGRRVKTWRNRLSFRLTGPHIEVHEPSACSGNARACATARLACRPRPLSRSFPGRLADRHVPPPGLFRERELSGLRGSRQQRLCPAGRVARKRFRRDREDQDNERPAQTGQ